MSPMCVFLSGTRMIILCLWGSVGKDRVVGDELVCIYRDWREAAGSGQACRMKTE